MRGYDLDLLRFLQVLIEEQSVSNAARRMNVSEPAMSRHLSKLRTVFGDPILVPSGRRLIASTFALNIRDRLQAVLRAADGLIETQALANLRNMAPKFTVRANDVIIAAIALPLLQALRQDCPNCELVFAPEFDEAANLALRDDSIDLYIGATDVLKPEIRRQTIFHHVMKALVRADHPILSEGVTVESLTRFEHISVSRRGRAHGPIDTILRDQFGLTRRVVLVVPNYKAMIDSIRGTDFIVTLPDMALNNVLITETGLAAIDYPFPLPRVEAFQAWHPRRDNDPVHRWLRETLFRVARKFQN
ncbi:LysR family transcriptional regulator [Acetobacter senegalensis DSM 18889]|uniref:LysR family transcriptional regulator n=1 Tax=Acetobacter tropicalis TaxID=104102 RepID=A0A149U8L0_9PROT|nr:LysR family transcriptional regulator [Acetobacter tropicalis]KXV61619.1 LysR family transcriptional regulator [Acetobacter tropicalis]GBR60244.1 LysR family transcriptional regulator [Acetobacter senegalensis DSM 18889]